jgi:predicted signal transduction protein with EAL and GGDEF domain
VVTSEPLPPRLEVANRWFPKARSWFALGAPLELLSPLSVLRIVIPLAACVWPALAVTSPLNDRTVIALLGTTLGYGIAWWALMRMRRISPHASWALTLAGLAGAVTVALAGGGSSVTVDYLLLSAPWCAFAALFFPARRVGLCLALVGIGGVVVASRSPDHMATVVTALTVTLAVATLALPLRLVAAAAGRGTTVDPDTGLPNARGLSQHVASATFPRAFVMGVICLTGLPEVREALGYEAASGLLRRAVEDLGQVVPAGSVIGRVDGDELVVLRPLPEGSADAPPSPLGEEAFACAEETARILRGAITSAPYLVGQLEISLGASVGLALALGETTGFPELLRRATEAARRAVATGQPCRIWDGRRDALTADDLALLADLRVAAERGELSLAYQPQVTTSEHAIVAVEALLRWDSPSRGRVAPSAFIPLAERTGLIERLTTWTLGEALDAQVRWRRDGLDLPVSFNLSAKQPAQPV